MPAPDMLFYEVQFAFEGRVLQASRRVELGLEIPDSHPAIGSPDETHEVHLAQMPLSPFPYRKRNVYRSISLAPRRPSGQQGRLKILLWTRRGEGYWRQWNENTAPLQRWWQARREGEPLEPYVERLPVEVGLVVDGPSNDGELRIDGYFHFLLTADPLGSDYRPLLEARRSGLPDCLQRRTVAKVDQPVSFTVDLPAAPQRLFLHAPNVLLDVTY